MSNLAPAVLTVATTSYAVSWQFALESQERYARRFGYRYVRHGEPSTRWNAKWSKLAYALEVIESGTDILLIDADAEITGKAPAFTIVLSENPEQDIFYVLGISGRPNSGVLILRGGRFGKAAELLKACIANAGVPVPKQDRVTKEGENGHIIHFLKQEPFASSSLELPLEWNCTRVAQSRTAYVRHYTNQLREALFKGQMNRRLSHKSKARSIAEQRHRNAAIFNHWQKPTLLDHFARSSEALGNFAKMVTGFAASQGLEFPRLVNDNARGWYWRYEFASNLLEPHTLEIVRRLSIPGVVAIDGGAHVGYFSRAIEEASGDCRVLGIEAHPDNYAALSANVGKSVTPVLAALHSTCGNGTLIEGQGHSNSSLLHESAGQKIPVALRTIDDICREHGITTVDLIKLDIEGLEFDALEGATDVIARSPGIVIIAELNPALLKLRNMAPDGVVQLAHKWGLEVRLIGEDFSFGPTGVALTDRARNYLIARPDRWKTLL